MCPWKRGKSKSNWMKSPHGLPAVLDHLMKHVDLTDFDPNGKALETNAKLDMIANSKTEMERWLSDVLTDDYIDKHLGAEVVSLTDLVERYHRETRSAKTNTTALSKALRRFCAYQQKRISFENSRVPVVSLRRHEFWAHQDNGGWADEYKKGMRKVVDGSMSL